MGTMALLLFLMLLDKGTASSVAPVMAAHKRAKRARDRAKQTGHPADVAAANQAQAEADATQHAHDVSTGKTPPMTHTSTPTHLPAGIPASAPPWPQAMPRDLPPFPEGWEADQPPSSAVVQRANALLPQLWAYGPGTHKTEQTAGRWTTYLATAMPAGRKGVTAWRPRIVPATMPAPEPTSEITPSAPPSSVLVHSPAPGTFPTTTAQPTLRVGSSGPAVVSLQLRLGVPADGKFGPQTRNAVIAFQKSRGLSADGVVGRATWAALGASRAAA